MTTLLDVYIGTLENIAKKNIDMDGMCITNEFYDYALTLGITLSADHRITLAKAYHIEENLNMMVSSDHHYIALHDELSAIEL